MNTTTAPKNYRLTNDQTSSLTEFAFELFENAEDTDAAINKLIGRAGEMLSLSNISVKEVVEGGHAIRCTYTWSCDGATTLLNLETRFLDNAFPEWKERYLSDENGVYIYRQSDGPVPISICERHRIRTLLQVPLYEGESFVGCIDFTDYSEERRWDSEVIAMLKSLGCFLTAFFFPMRRYEDVKEQLRESLQRDGVTGLPKYEEFIRQVDRARREDDGKRIVIISADTADFKYVNYRYGYEFGDTVLQTFVKTIDESFDSVVSCCREYSDNFVFAVRTGNDMPEEEFELKLLDFAANFDRAVRRLKSEAVLTLNIGASRVEEEIETERFVQQANEARKTARGQLGADNVRLRLFNDEMYEKSRREHELISRVDGAIEKREFKVWYQPKVSCRTGRIEGAEALIRWQEPDGKFIYPDEFIPAFEANGCIVKTDYFVYEDVFRTLRERLDEGLPVVPVSVNVSRVHMFSRAFVSYIELLRRMYRIPTELVEFEMTESVYVEKLPLLSYTINKMRSLGFKVSIDDFGSGYSSLEILTDLSPDVIKLDRIFLKPEMKSADRILITCIINMAKQLGMEVVCEGVETQEHRDFLTGAGCDLMQGYLFSKPVPAQDFEEMLARQES